MSASVSCAKFFPVKPFFILALLALLPPGKAGADDLLSAAKSGDAAAVGALIDAGAEIDATDGEGETALHKAAKGNHGAVVARPLAAGADPTIDAMGLYGGTGAPIHHAARYGRVESLRALLEGGVDPNLLSASVGTPLHLAMRAEQTEAAALLREHGAGSVKQPPVDHLIAGADAELGRKIANTCQLCHLMDLEPREDAVPGPPLWNVVGRAKASVDGYEYSEAMAALDGVWSFEDLNSLLIDAGAYVPGTKMDGVSGISGDKRRAALLRYLRDLADAPVALP